jgi:ABC-2 type transport system ATP-binding protein
VTAESRTDIVKVENLIKDFRSGFGLVRKRVLHGISFGVRQGEIFGFVGPNGAGKTTTLKILMGLIHAQGGSATILGHDSRESEYRRHVGFLPENPYFYDYLTGTEFLDFYARVSGVPAKGRARRISSLLEQVGLAHAADARLRTYSKGMLQRVGIAQAIVHDPDIVFLDEPMSGLDPIGRKEIRDLILRLNGEGKTIFMCTHILSDVEMLCHRVAIIVEGEIRYAGSSVEFLASEERGVDVVLARLPGDAVTIIEDRFGVIMRGQGDRIEMRVAEKDVKDLLRLALDTGSEVVSVAPHRVSLESIFLSAVGEGAKPGRANQEAGR